MTRLGHRPDQGLTSVGAITHSAPVKVLIFVCARVLFGEIPLCASPNVLSDRIEYYEFLD